MWFVYILLSDKDKRTYVGYASDVEKRLREHNSGKVDATRHRRPFHVIFKEPQETEKEAKDRERYWKSGAGRKRLSKMFNDEGFPPLAVGEGEARPG